jgi:hypothetical protein
MMPKSKILSMRFPFLTWFLCVFEIPDRLITCRVQLKTNRSTPNANIDTEQTFQIFLARCWKCRKRNKERVAATARIFNDRMRNTNNVPASELPRV